MSDYVRGLLTIPAALLALVAVTAVLFGAFRLLVRASPVHWSVRGPQRRARDAREMLRWVNAAGRHVATFRRLVAFGPWTLYVARYRPGNVTEEGSER
ncbi:hypothetical protein ACFFX1_55615 [Dactylosporangium sucinum]|uniref:hypothetical protein n=1 Tax=Dactylosporangium sucinum TaxID=1424081 RepID=UPI00167E1BCD|nr:hypothetical protein [Dactylosporangium sucinum]